MSSLRVLVLSVFFAICLPGCVPKPKPEAVEIPDIRTAPEFVEKRRLTFQGVPHFELMGVHEWVSGSTGVGTQQGIHNRKWRYVVPVTSENWKLGDSIPLWVSFSSHYEDVEKEKKLLKEALAAGTITGLNLDHPSRPTDGFRKDSAWQHAVANAEATHAIKSDPEAPIVTWPERD